MAKAARASQKKAKRALRRNETTKETPKLGKALEKGNVSGEHVDAAGAALRGVDADKRKELAKRIDALAGAASTMSAEEFGAKVRDEQRRLEDDEGDGRLARQQRAIRFNHRVDPATGMIEFWGKLDPLRGMKFAQSAEGAGCPSCSPTRCQTTARQIRSRRTPTCKRSRCSTSARGTAAKRSTRGHRRGRHPRHRRWRRAARRLGHPRRAPDQSAHRAWCATPTCTPSSCATERSSTLPADSTWAAPLGSRTSRNEERCERSTRDARSPTARRGSTTARSTTSDGGATVAAPTSKISCPSAFGITPRSTHEGWVVELGPDRVLTLTLPEWRSDDDRPTDATCGMTRSCGLTCPALSSESSASASRLRRRVRRRVPADEERDGVPLTNLDQPLFEGAGATKRDLVDYLDAVSDRILPELRERPLSVIRVHRGQEAFMQKNVPKYTPGVGAHGAPVGGGVEARGRVRVVQRPADVAVVRQPARGGVPPDAGAPAIGSTGRRTSCSTSTRRRAAASPSWSPRPGSCGRCWPMSASTRR